MSPSSSVMMQSFSGSDAAVDLLPGSNSEGLFKCTVLQGYWELDKILADLGFSERVHFLYPFLSNNISSIFFIRHHIFKSLS